FVMERDWWKVPFGSASRLAIVLGTAFPMLTHPGELLAAAVLFSLVTWLMIKTRSIWDCVAAHAVTNLILGIYVVLHGGDAWRLL
ncbi:MAG: CPBP family intramembrane metalloprotease, partial [Planctomycetaceae bacterium]|nr:CPBP family intramembrane metalloprotease [Planctomycetaceae bacterium]